MTKEEAIAYFKRHIELYCVTGICREAEEMAIRALEQEPCEDAISREAVLDEIRAEINGMYRVILKDTPKDDWAVRWNDCLDEVLQIIDKYRVEREVEV